MKLTILLILLFIFSGCGGAKLSPEPVGPSIEAAEKCTIPEIQAVTIEWGYWLHSLRQRITVHPDVATHKHFLGMQLRELEMKYADKLSARNSYTSHPIHLKALERNLTDSDFFELKERYYGVPHARYSGHVTEDGRAMFRVRGGTLDGWVIRITVTTMNEDKTVQLSNGSLNSFYAILKTIGNIDAELAELVDEPISWMKAIIAKF